MDLTKNMELFIVAIVAVVAAASLNRTKAPEVASTPTPVAASANAAVAASAAHVVHVSARRLSAEEKAVL